LQASAEGFTEGHIAAQFTEPQWLDWVDMATTGIALQPTPAIPHLTATATPHLTATATPRLTGTATPRRTWATPHSTSVTRRISDTPERSVIKSGAYAIRALPDLCLGEHTVVMLKVLIHAGRCHGIASFDRIRFQDVARLSESPTADIAAVILIQSQKHQIAQMLSSRNGFRPSFWSRGKNRF
jgi:hypothetical protein